MKRQLTLEEYAESKEKKTAIITMLSILFP